MLSSSMFLPDDDQPSMLMFTSMLGSCLVFLLKLSGLFDSLRGKWLKVASNFFVLPLWADHLLHLSVLLIQIC